MDYALATCQKLVFAPGVIFTGNTVWEFMHKSKMRRLNLERIQNLEFRKQQNNRETNKIKHERKATVYYLFDSISFQGISKRGDQGRGKKIFLFGSKSANCSFFHQKRYKCFQTEIESACICGMMWYSKFGYHLSFF